MNLNFINSKEVEGGGKELLSSNKYPMADFFKFLFLRSFHSDWQANHKSKDSKYIPKCTLILVIL